MVDKKQDDNNNRRNGANPAIQMISEFKKPSHCRHLHMIELAPWMAITILDAFPQDTDAVDLYMR